MLCCACLPYLSPCPTCLLSLLLSSFGSLLLSPRLSVPPLKQPVAESVQTDCACKWLLFIPSRACGHNRCRLIWKGALTNTGAFRHLSETMSDDLLTLKQEGVRSEVISKGSPSRAEFANRTPHRPQNGDGSLHQNALGSGLRSARKRPSTKCWKAYGAHPEPALTDNMR